jgi:hypothetical protein
MLGPDREEIERCVRESLLKLAQRFDIESVGPSLPVWPAWFQFKIGEVRPLLPPLDVLMSRWVKALDAPPAQSSAARAALAAILPRGISLRQDGCLAIAWPGPAVFSGLDMWARLSGRTLHEMWFRLPFFYGLSPERPSGVLVLSESQIVFTPRGLTPPDHFPDGLCIRRLAPEQVQTVRSQIDQVGTCWVGSLEETLRLPRIAFPADTDFESVSTNGSTTCALDRDGAMTCCGARLRDGQPPAAARWRAISVRRGGICGVSKSGDLTCVGDTAPFLKRQSTLTLGDGPLCAVDERGRPTCFEQRVRAAAAAASRLDRGLRLGCWKRERDGAEECATLVEILPGRGSWPAVDRISASPQDVCAISRDKKLICSSKGPSVDGDTGFIDVAISTSGDEACALKIGGELLCWSQHDGRPVSFSRTASFAALSPVIDQDAALGIGNDGKILVARRVLPDQVPAAAVTQPPTDSFKTVTAAGGHFCGVTTAGRVFCWGATWPGPNRRAAPGRD